MLVHDHGGCSQGDVVAAIKALGLWASTADHAKERIVAEYGYTDERGDLLYQVVRYEPKSFKQRYPDGHGGWVWRKHPRQVLYRLPEVLESAICFKVEGEKDAEILRDHGFTATTAAGGAKAAWLPEFTKALTGREVIIIPDNDPPGWNHAKTVARALLGHASRIIMLDDIARQGVKDVSDWFSAGHSEAELLAMLEGVNAR